jgi:hypothetical protein
VQEHRLLPVLEKQKQSFGFSRTFYSPPPPTLFSDHPFSFNTLLTGNMAVSRQRQLLFFAFLLFLLPNFPGSCTPWGDTETWQMWLLQQLLFATDLQRQAV